MASTTYDIITIGGGIAGAALAKAMAERGARVLVLERETAFRDRVRGEAIMPWGTAEAQELGLYDAIMASGGHDLRWWNSYQGSERSGHRDLVRTTAAKAGVTAFYHPDGQECLISAAGDAGAEVRRGVRVQGIETKHTPSVTADVDGRQTRFQARLVVAADGRFSSARRWAGFDVQRDPSRNLVAGVLFDDVDAPDDASHAWLNPELGLFILLFPQGNGRGRAYVCYHEPTGNRMTGDRDISRFIEESVKGGVLPEQYARAKPAGPLATFDGAASWVEHPYRDGVALIGAAAAAPDPTWGQGLSLSLRDARVLRDQLLSHDDWNEAGNAYAEEHDQYYGVVHDVELWQTQVLMETGPEADVRRQRAVGAWQEDRTRHPDTFLSGPGPTLDEHARRRFFGEA